MKKKIVILLTLIFLTPFVVNAYEVKKLWENNNSFMWNDYLINKDNSIITYASHKIHKYDKDGNLLWEKISEYGSNLDLDSGILLKDNGFILVGYLRTNYTEGFNDDGIIIKYDKDGNIVWEKTFGGSGYEDFDSISSTEDGGFVVGGTTDSTDVEGINTNGEMHAIILKFDEDGNMLWQNLHRDPVSGCDYFKRVISTKSGDIYAIDDYYHPAVIVKYDREGKMLWQKNLGEDGLDDGWFITKDEEIMASGFVDETQSYIIAKYNKEGEKLWQKDWYIGDEYQNYIPRYFTDYDEVIALDYGDYKDAIMIKYDKNGKVISQKVIPAAEYSGSYTVYTFLFNDNSEYIVTGSDYLDYVSTSKNFKYSIEYDLENVTTENGTFTSEQQGKYGVITPTPNEGYVVDKIIVKDSEGNEIEVTKLVDGTYSFELYDDVTIEVIYIKDFKIDKKEVNNGNVDVVKLTGSVGVIIPVPDKGYEVDKIIVKDKDGNVLDLVVTKQQDGTYTFELSDDVSIEVLFKKELVNPKTGVSNIVGIMFTMILMFTSAFFVIKNYNQRYEI